MIDSRCGLHCTGCEYKDTCDCGGCIETNGHPRKLLSAVHSEEGEEKLHLLMVGKKTYISNSVKAYEM